MKLSFLQRFTLVTFVVALACAIGLGYTFSARHLRALESDLVANSIGQTSALLATETADANPRTKKLSRAAYAAIAGGAHDATSFQEYVRAVRVYWPDGTSLYPAGAAPNSKDVQAAIAAQDVWRTPVQGGSRDPTFTAFVPIVQRDGSEYAVVMAMDFSVGQMQAQSLSEQRFVMLTTFGAVALIFLSLVALAYAAQRELNRRARLANETFIQTMEGIASIVDRRDPYTAGHSRRVATYSRKLAVAMRLSADEIRTIEHAALLHDLGKVGIPDAILLKQGPFNERERAIIQFHPDIAGEILANVEAMRDVVPCIVHHHERWDGSGYPRKLAAEKIPFGARVISVADAYDAMTTDRPYRRALTVEAAKQRLLEGAGQQFDERCVQKFVEMIQAGEVVPPTPITDAETLARSFGQQVPVEIA